MRTTSMRFIRLRKLFWNNSSNILRGLEHLLKRAARTDDGG